MTAIHSRTPRRVASHLAALIAAAGLSHCGLFGNSTDPSEETKDDPEIQVIDGQKDETDAYTEVVRLDNCSGTLVDAHHVLTAAHCFCHNQNGVANANNCQLYTSVTFISYTQGTEHKANSVDVRVHPDFEQIFNGPKSISSSNADIAVVTLDQAAPAWAHPRALSHSVPAVDEGVALVGYGYTSCNTMDFGVRYVGTNQISQLADIPLSADVTCITKKSGEADDELTFSGDSGGALIGFNGGELKGVTSYGSACGAGSADPTACFTRVDRYAAWIEQHLDAATPGCPGNYCQDHGQAAGFHCNGSQSVNCGTGADGCFVVQSSTSCVDGCNNITGKCELTCAQTCNGCCSGMSCQAGNSKTACGKNGVSCKTCGSNQTCNNGNCVSADCTEGEIECQGDALYYCNGGSWELLKQCGLTDCQNYGFDYYVGCFFDQQNSQDNCFCNWVTPQVDVTPKVANKGTTFSEPGFGFYPFGQAQLYFVKPDGSTYVDPILKNADGNGSYSHFYDSSTASQFGTYQYYAKDLTTNKLSNTVTFTINP